MSGKRKNNKSQSKGQTANDAAESNKQKGSRSTPKAKKEQKIIKYSFNDLPFDIMNAIIDAMTTPTFLQFRFVSKKWMRLSWKGRKTLDLTYLPPSKLPKCKQLKQLLEKAHGLRVLRTHMNMTGNELAEALDLENGCMSLSSITLAQKLQNCNEESFLHNIEPYLTRFTEIRVKDLNSPSKTFPGFGRLSQLRSLEIFNVPPEALLGLVNLRNLAVRAPLWSPLNWTMVVEQARKLESLSLSLGGDAWQTLLLTAGENLTFLAIKQAHPNLSHYALKLNEVASNMTRLETIEYPRVDKYYYIYHANNGEDWDCHKATFPPSIKKLKSFRTRSFAGLHSCLNLESLSVVSVPTNQNMEELNGLARLQEFFVQPTTLTAAKIHNPKLTDEALNYLKHAKGLHTLSFGFGTGAFTDLANIVQFKHLRHLSLNGHFLTSHAFTNIAQCQQLFSLAIAHMNEISATIFKPLTRLKYLACLMLYNCEGLTEKMCKQIDELTQLRDLRLERCKHVNDQALFNMSTIVQSHLLYLDITETGVGAKGLQFVRHLSAPSKREPLWWIENIPLQ